MNRIYTLCLILTVAFSWNTSAQTSNSLSKSWVSDNGDGTYTNPVLYADYSDPDVIRVGDDYYLTASSFNCVPGLPILHSRDLVNWELIGYALEKQPPFDVFNKVSAWWRRLGSMYKVPQQSVLHLLSRS